MSVLTPCWNPRGPNQVAPKTSLVVYSFSTWNPELSVGIPYWAGNDSSIQKTWCHNDMRIGHQWSGKAAGGQKIQK